MKRIFLFALFAMPFIGFAQSKLSYDLILNVSGVSNTTTEKTTSGSSPMNISPMYVFDSSGAPIILTSGSGNIYTAAFQKTNSLKYKSKITGGFTIGGRLVYAVHKNIGIGMGASISYFRATRTLGENNSGTLPSSLTFTGIGISSGGTWDSTRTLPAGTYSFSNGLYTEDKFRFVTLNIPVSINYSIAKWQLEAGLIASFIISSNKKSAVKGNFDPEISGTPSPYSDPSVPEPSPKNESKSFFSLSVSPQYQVSNNLKIGIEYIHGLSNAYSTNWYSQYTYPGMKTSSLGLKIIYKLK